MLLRSKANFDDYMTLPRENGLIARCEVIKTTSISHLMFMDDLLFSRKIS